MPWQYGRRLVILVIRGSDRYSGDGGGVVGSTCAQGMGFCGGCMRANGGRVVLFGYRKKM